MTIYVDEIIEQVLLKYREEYEKNPEPSAEPLLEWLAAKGIDKDSMIKALGRLVEEATGQILERMKSGIITVDDIEAIIYTATGIAFDAGYTGAEQQFGDKFEL